MQKQPFLAEFRKGKTRMKLYSAGFGAVDSQGNFYPKHMYKVIKILELPNDSKPKKN